MHIYLVLCTIINHAVSAHLIGPLRDFKPEVVSMVGTGTCGLGTGTTRSLQSTCCLRWADPGISSSRHRSSWSRPSALGPAGRAAAAAAATTLHSAVFGAAVAGGSAAHQHHRPGSSQIPAAPPQLLPLKTPNTTTSFPSEAAVCLPALTALHGCHGMCWVIV